MLQMRETRVWRMCLMHPPANKALPTSRARLNQRHLSFTEYSLYNTVYHCQSPSLSTFSPSVVPTYVSPYVNTTEYNFPWYADNSSNYSPPYTQSDGPLPWSQNLADGSYLGLILAPNVRITLILFSHLCLDIPSGLFPSGIPTLTLYALLTSPTHGTHRAYLIPLDLIAWTTKFERTNCNAPP